MCPVRPPGPLLAAGRDSEIFEYGPRHVLRRARTARSLAKEARVMAHVVAHGFPAPRVEEISPDGSELVMERVDGPTMLEALSRRPWTLRRHAAELAALHRRLHEIPGPDWLEPFFSGGDRLLHRDLHPLNVILSPRGPVLVDWTNASCGEGPEDVALTWLLMAAAELPGSGLAAAVGRALRGRFVRVFLDHFDLAPVRAVLAAAGEWKCADTNMRPAEIAAMRRLVARESG
jgi:aminoglycoside phosphotransferase (APT) family kinase protein